MASNITHPLVGLAVGRLFFRERMPARFWIISAALSSLPDADAIGFHFGVPYESFWGHRGFTHSLAFAALAAGFSAFAFFPAARRDARFGWRLVLCFFVSTASHGLLDAMTDGGLGVAFFSP